MRTMQFDIWKIEPVKELSRGAADLQRFVNTVNKHQLEQTEIDKSKTLFGTHNTNHTSEQNESYMKLSTESISNDRSSSSTIVPSTINMSSSQSKNIGQGLEPWVASTIRGLIKSIIKGTNPVLASNSPPPLVLVIPYLDKIIQHMRNYGKIPHWNNTILYENMRAYANDEGKIDVNTLCEIVGCTPIYSIKSIDHHTLSKKGSIKSIPKIHWIDMPSIDRHTIEHEKFKESEILLDTILRSGKNTNIKSLQLDAIKSATEGSRLMATRNSKSNTVPLLPPTEQIKSTSEIRADIMLFPRLLRPNTNNTMRVSNFSDIENEWKEKFLALGLRGHDLEFALDRKKRSYENKTNGMNSGRKTASLVTRNPRKPKPEEFQSSTHKSMWNTTTGMFLMTPG
jgi:hypothetical protein